MVKKKNNNISSFISENYTYAIVAFLLFVTVGPLMYALLKNIFGFNDDYSGLTSIGICIYIAYRMYINDEVISSKNSTDALNKTSTDNNKPKPIPSEKDASNTFTENERNQKELDNYVSKNHSKEEIGLFYERYIGYIFESKGWHVIYYGAKKGKEDEGIDLICVRKDSVRLVQCKYWSQNKTLFENNIFQLYGTWQLRVKNNDFAPKKSDAYLITSTVLSEFAKSSAETLGIKFKQDFKLNKNYPKIKCTTTKNGEKIYHLPTDQQYDNIGINKDSRRFYVRTVAEAVAKGHRRAYRHAYKN